MGSGWGSGGGRVRDGSQGRCERRSEVFVKIQKKNHSFFFFFFGGGGGGGRVRGGQDGCKRRSVVFEGVRSWGGQGGCERRIEVFVKIQKKKNFFGRGSFGGWGVGLVGGFQGECECNVGGRG